MAPVEFTRIILENRQHHQLYEEVYDCQKGRLPPWQTVFFRKLPGCIVMTILEKVKRAVELHQGDDDIPPDRWQNRDLLPLPPSRRKWTDFDFINLWSTVFLTIYGWQATSSLLSLGLNVWQSIVCTIIARILQYLVVLYLGWLVNLANPAIIIVRTNESADEKQDRWCVAYLFHRSVAVHIRYLGFNYSNLDSCWGYLRYI